MHGDVQIMKDKKFKTLVISEICIGIICVIILVCLLCLRGRGDISLAYLLLLVFMVIIMAAVGFIIVFIYKLTLQNKENRENYAKIEQKILSLEEHNKKNSKKKEIISENSQNILSITQSQLSNHIASVNITMLVMSIVCVFITIAIPILNYAFLNAEQIENMYANVDEKMETGISDAQKQMNKQVESELLEIKDQFDRKLMELFQTTLLQAQLNSMQFMDIDEIIYICTNLLQNYPDNADLYYNRGCNYSYSGDYEDAINDLLKAKELGYTNLSLLDRELCRAYSAMGDEFSVINVCNSHIPEEDYVYQFTILRADAYRNLKLYDKAEEEYLNMIAEMENGNHYFFNSNFTVGALYEEWGKYEEALRWYSKEVDEDPTDRAAYLFRGELYLQLKEYNLALEDLNRVIELYPDGSIGYQLRSEVQCELGNYDLALDDINVAIILDDNPIEYSELNFKRGNIYVDLGEYERAIDDYRICVAVNGNNSVYNYNLGEAYYHAGNYEEAVRYLTRAEELNLSYKWIYYYRARAYDMLGKADLALSDKETYLNYEDNN